MRWGDAPSLLNPYSVHGPNASSPNDLRKGYVGKKDDNNYQKRLDRLDRYSSLQVVENGRRVC